MKKLTWLDILTYLLLSWCVIFWWGDSMRYRDWDGWRLATAYACLGFVLYCMWRGVRDSDNN
jgi:hypothetical protein